jgi:methylmalonyl-CoA mutase cobalamin-binding subunit
MVNADMDGERPLPGQVPRDINALAQEVIGMVFDRQATSPSGARQYIFDYMLRAILRVGEFDSSLVLAELRGRRLHPDVLIDVYIPLVACELGEMWLRSDATFSEVTIGALRLQSLLSEASAEHVDFTRHDPKAMSALVVVPEAEQHFLGALVAAAQLRRLGVNVTTAICENDASILAEVEDQGLDMVLFSCARLEALEVVGRSVKKIRTMGKSAPVLALGGSLRGDAAGIRRKTDVDLFTQSVKEVVSFCTKRRQALSDT